MTAAPPLARPRRGWILYDGQCGFCRDTIHLWQATVERHGFAVKPLQAAQAEGLLSLPQESLLDDVRLLTPDNTIVSGANAYLHIARRIWWTWPFYAVFSLPGFHCLLDRTYRWINRNRCRLSDKCALP